MKKSLLVAATLSSLSTLFSTPSVHAEDLTLTVGGAKCTVEEDGSGSCSGALRDFFSVPNTTYALFLTNYTANGTFRRFTARINNSVGDHTFGCKPNATVTAGWSTAMTWRGDFTIHWDAGQVCDSLMLVNDSQATHGD